MASTHNIRNFKLVLTYLFFFAATVHGIALSSSSHSPSTHAALMARTDSRGVRVIREVYKSTSKTQNITLVATDSVDAPLTCSTDSIGQLYDITSAGPGPGAPLLRFQGPSNFTLFGEPAAYTNSGDTGGLGTLYVNEKPFSCGSDFGRPWEPCLAVDAGGDYIRMSYAFCSIDESKS